MLIVKIAPTISFSGPYIVTNVANEYEGVPLGY